MYPSIKALKQIKNANAILARQILLAKNCHELGVMRDTHMDIFKTTSEWILSCYNEPSFHEIKMQMLNEALGMFGVEYIPAGSNAKSPADDDIRLDHIPDVKECRQLLAQFKAQSFWPNVFHVNDHGNVDLLRITTRGARIIQSWV